MVRSNKSGSGWGSQGALLSCRSISSPFQNAKLFGVYVNLVSFQAWTLSFIFIWKSFSAREGWLFQEDLNSRAMRQRQAAQHGLYSSMKMRGTAFSGPLCLHSVVTDQSRQRSVVYWRGCSSSVTLRIPSLLSWAFSPAFSGRRLLGILISEEEAGCWAACSIA